MLLTVMVPPSEPQRLWQEPFLDVITNRPSGNATEVSEVPNGVASLSHDLKYATVTVTLSSVALTTFQQVAGTFAAQVPATYCRICAREPL